MGRFHLRLSHVLTHCSKQPITPSPRRRGRAAPAEFPARALSLITSSNFRLENRQVPSGSGPSNIEPPCDSILISALDQVVLRSQERRELRPMIGDVKTARFWPLRVGKKDSGWGISFERADELFPNGIRGKEKREPLDVRRGVMHPSPCYGQEGTIVRVEHLNSRAVRQPAFDS